jgi:hypothetical protein
MGGGHTCLQGGSARGEYVTEEGKGLTASGDGQDGMK